MSRGGSLFLRIVAALLVIGLLAAAGVWIYQAGQAEGYAMGLAAAAADAGEGNGAQVAPPWPGYYRGFYPGFYPGFHRPFFFPFGPLFGLFFFVLFFFLIGGLFRRAWGWGRPPAGWYGYPPTHQHPEEQRKDPENPGTGS